LPPLARRWLLLLTCDGRIAIGGSLLLDHGDPSKPMPIVGGAGAYPAPPARQTLTFPDSPQGTDTLTPRHATEHAAERKNCSMRCIRKADPPDPIHGMVTLAPSAGCIQQHHDHQNAQPIERVTWAPIDAEQSESRVGRRVATLVALRQQKAVHPTRTDAYRYLLRDQG
jgi:hypothetical protein